MKIENKIDEVTLAVCASDRFHCCDQTHFTEASRKDRLWLTVSEYFSALWWRSDVGGQTWKKNFGMKLEVGLTFDHLYEPCLPSQRQHILLKGTSIWLSSIEAHGLIGNILYPKYNFTLLMSINKWAFYKEICIQHNFKSPHLKKLS